MDTHFLNHYIDPRTHLMGMFPYKAIILIKHLKAVNSFTSASRGNELKKCVSKSIEKTTKITKLQKSEKMLKCIA